MQFLSLLIKIVFLIVELILNLEERAYAIRFYEIFVEAMHLCLIFEELCCLNRIDCEWREEGFKFRLIFFEGQDFRGLIFKFYF